MFQQGLDKCLLRMPRRNKHPVKRLALLETVTVGTRTAGKVTAGKRVSGGSLEFSDSNMSPLTT